MDIYLEDLAELLHSSDVTVTDRMKAYVKDATLYKRSDFFRDDLLYIADGTSDFASLTVPPPANICFVSENGKQGDIPDSGLQECNIIWAAAQKTEPLLNRIKEILFQEYRRLNKAVALFKDVYDSDDIHEILKVGYKLIGNPMFVRDSYFKIWGFTENVHIDDLTWEHITEKGYQEFRDYKHFLSYGLLERLHKMKKAIYFDTHKVIPENRVEEYKYHVAERAHDPSNFMHINRIWTDISSGDTSVGHVVVLEAFKKFTHTDIQIMRLIADALLIVIRKNLQEQKTNQNMGQLFISELLERKLESPEIIRDRLKFLHWSFSGPMQLAVVSAVGKVLTQSEIIFTRNWFSNLFREVSVTQYEDFIIVIFNPRLKSNRFSEVRERFDGFLEEQELMLGISREFLTLPEMKTAYDQAFIAIRSGLKEDENRRVFFYNDYVLPHIFSTLKANLDLKKICRPEILMLIEYDENNNTRYVEFLKNYLKYVHSPVNLSKALGVHRNTLYYRINKIEELTGVSLSDAKVLFEMYLTFEVLKYLENR